MKKNSVYIGGISVLVGLLLGYFIFGSSTEVLPEEIHDHTTGTTNHSWTCSMHPQIVQSEQGDCPICSMDLIPGETTEDGLSIDQFRMTENAIALANIETTTISSGSGTSQSIQLSGKIKENEEALVALVAHFSGRIERLLVHTIGEKVRRGQIIAMVYAPELVTAQQELLTAAALKNTQPALYQAVLNKLKLRKISDDLIQQIESSGTIKESFPIHAHVSGIVSEKMVEEGNHIMRGDVLFKVANLHTVWAEFDIYENQISVVSVGQKIKMKTNAYPNKLLDAEISFIDPILNATTRTVKARAVLKNDDALFKPGMFVEGEIANVNNKLSLTNPTIMVPKSAVLWTGKRSVVYIKTETNPSVFEMREVTLGDSNGDSYLIADGLKNGDEVVTNGTFTVDAAAQLQGKKSMMKPK